MLVTCRGQKRERLAINAFYLEECGVVFNYLIKDDGSSDSEPFGYSVDSGFMKPNLGNLKRDR